jgi:preprotein translocase subunit YajC
MRFSLPLLSSLLLLLGITDVAHAANATTSTSSLGGSSSMSFLPMLLLLIVFMYFVMIRPQTKRAKEHKNLVNNLKDGDEVLTIGGIFGKIVKIADNTIVLSIAEGVNISIQKSAVASCIPKGTLKTST